VDTNVLDLPYASPQPRQPEPTSVTVQVVTVVLTLGLLMALIGAAMIFGHNGSGNHPWYPGPLRRVAQQHVVPANTGPVITGITR
jgi:hypothetical protein